MGEDRMTAVPPAPCPYCGGAVELVDASVIYGRDGFGKAWVCINYPKCDSYVGCHRNSDHPKGRLANKELRNAKIAAHAAFDPLWKAKRAEGYRSARIKAYTWLAREMNITRDHCHIGMFDIEQCRRVVEICRPFNKRERSVTLGLAQHIQDEHKMEASER